MPAGRLVPVLVILGLLAGACSPTGQAETSPTARSPGEAATGTAVPNPGLPPDCEPITLRDPNGQRIDLGGTWIEDVPEGQTPMTWWLREAGDCVWGAGVVDNVIVDTGSVQTLRGRIGTDFVIEGEILVLGPVSSFFAAAPFYSPVRMLIEFDEQGTLLREDRVQGDRGPRCAGPGAPCLRPLVLRPAAQLSK